MKKPELIKSYQNRLRKHGPSSQAVQYSDQDSHFARFHVLAGVDPEMASVLDVGCGLCDFWRYLRATGSNARYCGVDIVPDFVDLAKAAMATDPDADVHLVDVDEGELPKGYDYAVLSGVFNNVMEDNWGFMTTTLRKMWTAAGKGIAFNAMSTHVDYRAPDLYYVDPVDVFGFCKGELGGHPVLRHDYVTRTGGFPFEFAVYVYKEPTLSKH
jgi:SAM-dependent methyltransferase